jgi:hypothetical protein
MSWSLKLRNGDLATGGARLGQVTGANKLVQDLRCALLTHRGHNEYHPRYGSIIDGGRTDAGDEAVSIIGSTDWERVALRVEGEIRRISADHQQQQLARAQKDRYTYGESTLSNDELLLEVTDVAMTQAQDALFVQVTLTTGTGKAIPLNIPVTDQPVIT